MRTYEYALSIINSSQLSAVEKVGIMSNSCYMAPEAEAVEQWLKLTNNVRWFINKANGFPANCINRIRGGFDPISRVFWLSFDKEDYFDYGGKQAIADMIKGMTICGYPMVARRGDSKWWGVFPAARKNEDQKPMQERQEERELERATVVVPSIQQQTEEEHIKPVAVKEPKKATVKRNIKRKKQEEIKLNDLEEIEEDE